jgi:Flp pilus assembly protein TadG
VKRIRRSREDQGAAAVEFALVLPVLVLILFGIVDLGRMLNARITLSQAAHEGARAAAIADDDVALDTVTRVMGSMATAMDGPPTILGCDGTRDEATVTVTYRFDFATPIFGSDTQLSATAVVPCL